MAGNLAEFFVLVYILLFMLGIEQKQTDFERFQSWFTNVWMAASSTAKQQDSTRRSWYSFRTPSM